MGSLIDEIRCGDAERGLFGASGSVPAGASCDDSQADLDFTPDGQSSSGLCCRCPTGNVAARDGLSRSVDSQAVRPIPLPRLPRQGHENVGVALDELIAVDIDRNPAAWEKVVRKLASRQMPPKAGDAAQGTRIRRGRFVAGIGARCRRRGTSESRAHRNIPPPQPHGVSEHRPRPAGAGCERRGALAAG